MQEMQHRMLFLIISSSALSLCVGNATIIERREEVAEKTREGKRVKREKTWY